jgi:hypothetical protein
MSYNDYQHWQLNRDFELNQKCDPYQPRIDVRDGNTPQRPDEVSFAAPADAHESSRKFYAVLAEAAKLHDKKQRDYGSDADPFANVRASEDFGIPAWLGCIIRGNDKVRRIQSFATRGELANESIEDALIDLLVYAGIALVLYRESL